MQFKKITALFCSALMLVSNILTMPLAQADTSTNGVNFDAMRSYGLNENSYFWKKAIWTRTNSSFAKDVITRPYPRLIGNQWNVLPNGSEDNGDTNKYQEYAAKHFDFIFLNRVRGSYSDKFVDVYDSLHNPNTGLLKYRNNVYNKASKYNRRCYVLIYHAAEGIENYSPPTSGHNYWFSNNVDNPWRTSSNKGTWDLVSQNNAWYKNSDGSYVAYTRYSTSVRRMFDMRRSDMRAYWASHAYHASMGDVTNQFDGIFADNWLRSTGPDTNNWMNGVNTAGGMLKSRWNNDKILIGNGYYTSRYNTRDFGMLEDWSGNWKWDFSESDRFVNAGQLAMDTSANSGYGSLWDRLARNLMTDDVFGIHDDENGGVVSFIDNYISKLGKIGYPLEDRVNNSGVYSRKFTNGIAYWNNSGGTRTVNVPSGVYKDINGNTVQGNVSLGNRKGLILKSSSITPETPTIPTAPSNLVSKGIAKGATTGNYYVNLEWRDNSTNEDGFQLKQSFGGTENFNLVETIPSSTSTYSYNLGSSPEAGKYYYKLNAFNTAGDSTDSNIVFVEITKPPTSPSNLVVDNVAKTSTGVNVVTLSWADTSDNETGFKVLQSVGDSNNFQLVKEVSANVISANIELDANASSGSYYYQVVSVNTGGMSSPSNTASATIEDSVKAPSNMRIDGVAKGATSGNYYVNVAWTDNSNDETGFEIYHAVNNGSYSLIKTPVVNSQSYGINLGATPEVGTHHFKVRALKGDVQSEFSNVADAQILAPVEPTVKAPSNMKVNSVAKSSSSGSYYVNVSWTDNASDETGFEIYHAVNNGSYSLIKTPAVNAQSYGINIGTAPEAGTHHFKVRALKGDVQSEFSNVADAQIAAPVVPTVKAPSNMKVNSLAKGATSGNYYASVSWTDNSDDETGFEIYHAVNNGSYSLIKTPVVNAQSYGINLGATPEVGTHHFKVRALKGDVQSEFSNVVDAQISAPVVPKTPIAPSNMRIDGVAKSTTSGSYFINVAWTDNSDDETGFEIHHAVNSGTYSLIKTPAVNSQSYGINIGANPTFGDHHFKVRALNKNGASSFSNLATAKINAPVAVKAPSNVRVDSVSGSYIYLKWTDNSNDETGFEIYQSINNGSYNLIKTPKPNSTNYGIFIGANPTKGTYKYKVLAVKGSEKSSSSNTATASVK